MEVSKSASAKVNLGDYQSADFFVAIKKELDDRATAKEIQQFAAKLQAACNEALLNDLRAHFATRGKKYTDDNIRRMYGIPKSKPAENSFG